MSEAKNKLLDKTISVKLPADLLKKAKKKSQDTGIPISFIVRQALEKWVMGDKE